MIYQLTSLARNLSLQLKVLWKMASRISRRPLGCTKWQTGASVSSGICLGLFRMGILTSGSFSYPKAGKINTASQDFPLGAEEVQFTFNIDEIDLRKPYAKE